MEIIDKKYNGKEETTAFHLKSSGKIVSRLLSTKLDRDDWEIIHNLLHFVYSQGVEAGSNGRTGKPSALLEKLISESKKVRC